MAAMNIKLGVLLALASSTGMLAQQNSMPGTWTATVTLNNQPVSINVVLGPKSSYSQVLRAGQLQTTQTGSWTFENGALTLTVQDWEPKRQWIVDANGGGHWEATAKPPTSVFRVTFTNANTSVWNDVNTHATVTFHRGS